jgi:Flp pilus assembly pilin Flp
MIIKNQKGQTGIEYALICIVLLAIVTVAVAQPLKDALTIAFQRVKNDVAASSS